jgi:hypothetical protein
VLALDTPRSALPGVGLPRRSPERRARTTPAGGTWRRPAGATPLGEVFHALDGAHCLADAGRGSITLRRLNAGGHARDWGPVGYSETGPWAHDTTRRASAGRRDEHGRVVARRFVPGTQREGVANFLRPPISTASRHARLTSSALQSREVSRHDHAVGLPASSLHVGQRFSIGVRSNG